MKKRIILAVLLVVPFGIALGQNVPDYSTMQSLERRPLAQANAPTAQMTTTAETTKMTYDGMVAQVKSAIEAIKKAMGNMTDSAAWQEALAKIKLAAQAIKDLVTGKITNNNPAQTGVSNKSLSSDVMELLKSKQPVDASK